MAWAEDDMAIVAEMAAEAGIALPQAGVNREICRALKPRRIQVCVLLDKPARRVEDVEADYVGFKIPDYFVVGYGLDFAERYRNLPFVGVLHQHIYKQACQRINEVECSKARPRKRRI